MHETIDLIRLSLQAPEPHTFTDRNGVGHNLCPTCSVDWDVLNNSFRSHEAEEQDTAQIIARNCPSCRRQFGSWLK